MRPATRFGVAAVIVAAALVGPRPGPVRADTGRQIDGQSGPSGVAIRILRWDGEERVRVTGGDRSGCAWSIVPPPTGTWYTPPEHLGPRPTPQSTLGVLACNGVGLRLIWVDPGDVLDVAAEARRVVQEYLATVPVPEPTIAVRPADGLVGVEAGMRLEGASAAPITAELSAFGIAVDVRISPGPVTWSFGDGASVTEGFDPVEHVYTHRSTSAGPSAPYGLNAGYDLEPVYRIDRGAWIDLPAIPVTADRPYVVREAQAVIG